MKTPDFEHGIVYFKQFGAERVKQKKLMDTYTSIQPDLSLIVVSWCVLLLHICIAIEFLSGRYCLV